MVDLSMPKTEIHLNRGANQVMTMIPNSEVGTVRRTVIGRLGEAIPPKADSHPFQYPFTIDAYMDTWSSAGHVSA
jgi:hypothetical protein